jgi:threonine synthase
MKYYSTKNKKTRVSLKEAVLQGMPCDGGLYMPESIPRFNQEEMAEMQNMNLKEIAAKVLYEFVSEDISLDDLNCIVHSALNFEIPLHHLDKNKAVLELFHGPTLAFKDVGARFMSRLLAKLIKDDTSGLNIIVATSGDTGSAVANGFYDVEGINVFILFPSGKVSTIQRKQMTTLGKNIMPIEVNGTFDDCQRIVKKLLNDEALNKNHRITTANSINIARLLPQTVYYFKAYFEAIKQLGDKHTDIVFSVPSGNFGNLCAGLFAQKMGLKCGNFIAATNINDVVPEYLKTGIFTSRSSMQTISNAMDVGNPSNFERILDLFDNDYSRINSNIAGMSFDDEETKKQIKNTWTDYKYILDPHGAVGLLALNNYTSHAEKNTFGIALETAHPAKFRETVESVLNVKLKLPERLLKCEKKEEFSIMAENDYPSIKRLLNKKLL